MDYIIRKATKEDASAVFNFIVTSFQQSYCGLSKFHNFDLFSVDQFVLSGNAEYIRETFHTAGRNTMLIALNGDGLIVAALGASKTAAHEYEVHSFYVDITHQGAGLGSKMWEISMAELSGAKVICLDVFEVNKKSIAIYEKWGFIPALGGTFPFRWTSWPDNVSVSTMRYFRNV